MQRYRITPLILTTILILNMTACQKEEPSSFWDTYSKELSSEELANPNTRFQHYTYTVPAGYTYSDESDKKNTYIKSMENLEGSFGTEKVTFLEVEIGSYTKEEALATYEQAIYKEYGEEVEQSSCTIQDRNWKVYEIPNYTEAGVKYNCIMYLYAEDYKDLLMVEYFGISEDNIASEIVGEMDDQQGSTAINLEDYNVMYWKDTEEDETEEVSTREYVVANSTSMEQLRILAKEFVTSIRKK